MITIIVAIVTLVVGLCVGWTAGTTFTEAVASARGRELAKELGEANKDLDDLRELIPYNDGPGAERDILYRERT